MSQPLIRQDSYWADAWNILMLRPVYREAKRTTTANRQEKASATEAVVESSPIETPPASEPTGHDTALNGSEEAPGTRAIQLDESDTLKHSEPRHAASDPGIDFSGLGGALWTIAASEPQVPLSPEEKQQVDINMMDAMLQAVRATKDTQRVAIEDISRHFDAATMTIASNVGSSEAIRQAMQSYSALIHQAIDESGFVRNPVKAAVTGILDASYAEGKHASIGSKFAPYYRDNQEIEVPEPARTPEEQEQRNESIYRKDLAVIEKLLDTVLDRASKPRGWRGTPRKLLLDARLQPHQVTPALLVQLGYNKLDAAIASGYLNNANVADVAKSVNSDETTVEERIHSLMAELGVGSRLELFNSILRAYLQYISQDLRYLYDATTQNDNHLEEASHPSWMAR